METPTPSTDADREPQRGNPWTFPLILFVALAISATLLVKFRQDSGRDAAPRLASSAGSSQTGWSDPVDPQEKTVSLAIDFRNGVRREFAALLWTEGMTVADLLESAAEFEPGIRYSQQGEGELAMLTAIDGVTNGTPAGRFWLYEVNGRLSEVSFAVQPLAAGDKVLWAFKPPE